MAFNFTMDTSECFEGFNFVCQKLVDSCRDLVILSFVERSCLILPILGSVIGAVI
jgi:hypothetical protein